MILYSDYGSVGRDLYVSKEDKKDFLITKVKDEWDCCECNEKISKGSICMGKSYHKCCLKCIPKFLNKLRIQIKEGLLDEFDKVDLDITTNKDEYERINALAKIGENGNNVGE
jgi:hypothetical protein